MRSAYSEGYVAGLLAGHSGKRPNNPYIKGWGEFPWAREWQKGFDEGYACQQETSCLTPDRNWFSRGAIQ
jgi:hypothetical protein